MSVMKHVSRGRPSTALLGWLAMMLISAGCSKAPLSFVASSPISNDLALTESDRVAASMQAGPSQAIADEMDKLRKSMISLH